MDIDIKLPFYLREFVIKNSLHRLDSFKIWKNSQFIHCDSNSEDIDNGVCGIVLFLMEYSKFNEYEENYKEIVKSGDEILKYVRDFNRFHYGFLKGRSGVCYTFQKLTEFTGNKKYLSLGKELIIENSKNFIYSEFSNNSLYDGLSGLLLVLINMYYYDFDVEIYCLICKCIEKIVEDFYFSPKGVFCSKNDKNIRPDVSFFHGASGVAYVLNMIGECFNCNPLLEISKSVFNQIDSSLKINKYYCSDFTMQITNEIEYKFYCKLYRNGNLQLFNPKENNFGLRAGESGLFLSKLAVVNSCAELPKTKELLFNQHYLRGGNLSLGNGLAGFFLMRYEFSLKFNNNEDEEELKDIFDFLVSQINSISDLSFFNGITGICYMLMIYANKSNSHCLFNEIYNTAQSPCNSNSPNSVKIDIIKNAYFQALQKTYPKTFTIFLAFHPEGMGKFYNDYVSLILIQPEKAESLLLKFILEMKSVGIRFLLKEIFTIEKAKLRLYINSNNLAIDNMEEMCVYDNRTCLLQYDDSALLDVCLVFKKNYYILNTKWDWTKILAEGVIIEKLDILSEKNATNKFRLLISRNIENDLLIEKIDEFGQLTLEIFSQPTKVKSAINQYIESFHIRKPSDKFRVKSLALQYIRYYIKKMWLKQYNL